MYRDRDNVIKEDEQLYGENMDLVDKKTPSKKVHYSEVFD